jgi:putative Holliday junction resolvase
MNYLGIDYGERRIGLAKAESGNKIAIPFKTIDNSEDVISEINDIVSSENIDIIIVGLPVSFDGKENKFAQKVREFGSQIGLASGKPVKFENEVFSSKIAADNSSKIDESSAALILQSFLDRKAAV